MVLSTEGHVTPQVQGTSATLGPDAQPVAVPYQPEVPSMNNEASLVPVKMRHEESHHGSGLRQNSCCLHCMAFHSCWNNCLLISSDIIWEGVV